MAKKAAPTVTFNGNVYDADDCIQNARLTINGAEVTYQCNGYEKVETGNLSIRLSFSMALEATDTAKAAALAVGATGTSEFHPAGDTGTYIEHTTTAAYVLSYDESADINSVIMADVVIGWNDITTGAAV